MDSCCDICGNEIPNTMLNCRFCGNKQQGEWNLRKNRYQHRVINLETGKPVVEAALVKFKQEISTARLDKITVVTVIHGYGSSGKGGAIRSECRKLLEYLESKRNIRGFIPGENFTRKQGQTRALLRRIPQLTKDNNLNRKNRGVTIVEL